MRRSDLLPVQSPRERASLLTNMLEQETFQAIEPRSQRQGEVSMSKLRFLLLVSDPDLVGSSCQGSDAARHPLVPASFARPRFLMRMQMLVVA